MKKVLAFDFGASSGRAVLSYLENGKLMLKEVHRFANDPVFVNGVLYWDVLRLFHEIKQGMINAKNAGGFDAVGIDTWGVDFGMLNPEGELISNPVHYRDARTEGVMESVFQLISPKDLYLKTGLQFLRFNTLYQLYYLKTKQPKALKGCDKILLMADLFSYFLTGEKKAEFSNVSTTQMLDQNTDDWHYELLERVGISPHLLPPVIHSGGVYGFLKEDICKELGVQKVPVIAVASHDTASAVVSVPSEQKDFLFLSCGTWSLFGTELQKPVINQASYERKVTNERGHNKTTRFLKNIMGLWIIQECKKQWEKEGDKLSFSDIAKLASQSKPFACRIDVDDKCFELPNNMVESIQTYCKKTKQFVPQTIGEIARCVYESLAFQYYKTLKEIEKLTGKTYDILHIVGGGCNAELLCQFAANACNLKVIAGPSEGTAAGNALVQLIALKEIKSLSEARLIVKDSVETKEYKPIDAKTWQEEFKKTK